ncbi:metal-sulfur cluster assembly factor [Convivina praedatoris]|uniref:Fe-S protein maturation auxiliary factor SufT n=1 Tax=Convivina praedatoris TaxID=2880963 RepID=A0ABN8H6Z0_9LACO|nr:iron-sulfur cluster assembly protein [Convivina sp. LMG 32447]CAH1850072.1 Fe-S protein maturation auxiliary factor SufT [Convivina sp. LMG 32447]CAH1850083.1 Fe-S protein maturation auxiliary factor SufT [Convivina sp. LMG 32447]CAH1851130.1 Fe-S protein maturation auxiliary factor SufT [Convivina sp. LMG 32447]
MDNTENFDQQMLACLEKVIDPELQCDIVNLGLIYGLDFNKGTVTVQMTLTTMGCPIMGELEHMVKNSLRELPNVTEVMVDFVWEPAWSIDRMSRYAKMALGLH